MKKSLSFLILIFMAFQLTWAMDPYLMYSAEADIPSTVIPYAPSAPVDQSIPLTDPLPPMPEPEAIKRDIKINVVAVVGQKEQNRIRNLFKEDVKFVGFPYHGEATVHVDSVLGKTELHPTDAFCASFKGQFPMIGNQYVDRNGSVSIGVNVDIVLTGRGVRSKKIRKLILSGSQGGWSKETGAINEEFQISVSVQPTPSIPDDLPPIKEWPTVIPPPSLPNIPSLPPPPTYPRR